MSLTRLSKLVQKQLPGSVHSRQDVWVTAEPPILSGYSFERSLEPKVFRLRAILIPAYVRKQDVILNYSADLWPSDGTSTWQYEAKREELVVPDILKQICGPGARFLEKGRNLAAFLAYLTAKYPPPVTDPHRRLAFGCGEALLGHIEEAVGWLEPLLAPDYLVDDRAWVRALSQQASEAIAAMKQGSGAIRRLLDGWSHETLVNYGIASRRRVRLPISNIAGC